MRDLPSKLVCIDINLHLGLFVAPRELGNFGLGSLLNDGLLFFHHLSLQLRDRFDQNRVTTINFAIAFEVLSSLSGEVGIGVRIIILRKEMDNQLEFSGNFSAQKIVEKDDVLIECKFSF